MYRGFAKIGFAIVACLSAGGLAVCPDAWAECTGPASLEARVQAHPDAGAYAELGVWFYQNHKVECAVEALRSGLKLAPDSPQLNYLLGGSLYSAGRFDEAVTPLKAAVRLNPGELQAHLLLGAALAQLGRNQEAASEWSAALKIDPTSKAALDGQAKSLIAAGDYASVIRNLSGVTRDDNLTLDLAIAYRDAGILDKAEQTLKQGLDADPDSDALTTVLVSLYDATNHAAAANELAGKIAHDKPGDLEAQRIYLRTLVVLGDRDRAVSLGKKLLALAPHDADLLNLNGDLEMKAGDYPAARKHLEEAVALDPNDPGSRANLGLVLVKLNDPAGAKIQLEKALALDKDEPRVHYELAMVLRTLGETEEAQQQLVLYQQKRTQEPDRAIAVSKATEAAEAVKAGDNQKAAELYRQACVAEPQNADLAYRLALVLDNLGDRAGEQVALEQAIQANPHFVPAQFQLGVMDLQAGDNAGAERQFRLAVEGAPGNAQAWTALAAALGAESRYEEARKAVATALRLDPTNAAALITLGGSLYAAGRFEEAVTPLKTAVRLNPGELQAHLLLGATLAQLGRNREAASEWSAALKIDPTSKAALDGQAQSLLAAGDYAAVVRNLSGVARDDNLTLDLAIAYRDSGILDEAEQTLKQGLDADPESDALTATLVELYDATSHADAANELAEKIAREKPGDLDAQRIYLRTLVILGDSDHAVPLGKKLLALAPHDADLLNLNGELEMKAGDYQAARKHLEEAVALNPNDSDPRVNLGLVLAALNDPAGAKVQFEKAIVLNNDEPWVHYELATVLRTLGETDAAQQQITLYQQKQKLESDRAVAVSKEALARDAVKAGDNQKAAELYRQLALALDNLGDRAGERAALEQTIQLGYIDLQTGDKAGAERQFRLTIQQAPDNVQAWTALAAALGAESKFEEARKAVATALRLDPTNAAALNLSRELAVSQNQH